MHKNEVCGCLLTVITAQEAAQLWGLSRNAISDACRRGAIHSRRSGQTWLVTIEAMLRYQRGRYWPDNFPDELRPALESALARMQADR